MDIKDIVLDYLRSALDGHDSIVTNAREIATEINQKGIRPTLVNNVLDELMEDRVIDCIKGARGKIEIKFVDNNLRDKVFNYIMDISNNGKVSVGVTKISTDIGVPVKEWKDILYDFEKEGILKIDSFSRKVELSILNNKNNCSNEIASDKECKIVEFPINNEFIDSKTIDDIDELDKAIDNIGAIVMDMLNEKTKLMEECNSASSEVKVLKNVVEKLRDENSVLEYSKIRLEDSNNRYRQKLMAMQERINDLK